MTVTNLNLNLGCRKITVYVVNLCLAFWKNLCVNFSVKLAVKSGLVSCFRGIRMGLSCVCGLNFYGVRGNYGRKYQVFSLRKHGGFSSVGENSNVKVMDNSFSVENKSLVFKYCFIDQRRCYSSSCDIVLVSGEVVSCKRRRGVRSRFTKAKNGSVDT